METWQAREWFAEYLDALNRHDLDAVRSLLDPFVRRAHRAAGADAWLADLADLFAGFPDWRWKRIHLVVDGDQIAAHLRASGTHTRTFAGIAGTRRHVNIAEYGFFRLAGGRVTEYAGTGLDAVVAEVSR